MNTKRVSAVATSKGSIPEGPSWAIITFGSVYIPGDERSRTNPGHGYPEHTESTISYEVFFDEAEWKLEVERRTAAVFGGKEFVAIAVKRPSIKTRVVVEMS